MSISRTKRNSLLNLPMLLRIVGFLLLVESAFMLIPLITTIVYEEHDFWAFLITFAVTLVAGLLLTMVVRPSRSDMGKREGILLTAFTWLSFTIFGMVPYLLSSTPQSFNNAFFETISGFTTTGATVLPTVENLSHGILIWRSLTQWIGGMGIILFTIALLPMLNYSGGIQMFNAEVTGITHERLRPRISQTAKGLWLVYITLTALMCVVLCVGPMGLFDSICHSFSCMATGGFSTRDAGIEAWGGYYNKTVITVFLFLSGTNFTLIYRSTVTRDPRVLFKNETFRTYIGIVVVAFILSFISIGLLNPHYSIAKLTFNSLFHTVSTASGTGHLIEGYDQWGAFAMSVTFVLMFIGACAGSTTGAVKVDRIICLAKNCRNEIKRAVKPNHVLPVRLNGKVLPTSTTNKVVSFTFLFIIVTIAGGLTLTAMGVPLIDSAFSAFSCITNVGFGAGITGYGAGGYEIIPDAGKWVLALLMLIGRLEIFTILALFSPTFWKR